jgi:hypothetical protein
MTDFQMPLGFTARKVFAFAFDPFVLIGHWSVVIGHWDLVIGHSLARSYEPISPVPKRRFA